MEKLLSVLFWLLGFLGVFLFCLFVCLFMFEENINLIQYMNIFLISGLSTIFLYFFVFIKKIKKDQGIIAIFLSLIIHIISVFIIAHDFKYIAFLILFSQLIITLLFIFKSYKNNTFKYFDLFKNLLTTLFLSIVFINVCIKLFVDYS